MKQAKPSSEDYSAILYNIKRGKYQIPKFQRDFVWSIQKTAELIDSLIKGFPIGSFILWKTSERLRSVKKLGGVELIEPREGEEIYYVLDGQQRLTSLYLALRGLETEKANYKEIYIDLSKDIETDKEICSLEETETSIPFYKLMSEELIDYVNKMDKDLLRMWGVFSNIVKTYDFSTIEIKDQPLEKIAEIFTRINTGGKVLTLFEIVNAKIYTEEKLDENNDVIKEGFDLEQKFDNFIEDLKGCNYETIGENKSIILQLISLIISENASREHILAIEKSKFIDEWDNTIECANRAIDKIGDYFHVPASKLLPYLSLMIPMACFYKINNFTPPNPIQLKLIKNHFFRTALTNRFTSSTDTKLGNDMKLMKSIAEGQDVRAELEKEIPIDNLDEDYFKERIKTWNISTSNAFDKAVLCIIASRTPKRFNDNSKVRLDNSWLSISTSKNYHHFFPKAFLKKQGNDEYANSIANITFVDDYLNKNVIKAKAPSEYIGKFASENPDGIKDALESHFIGYEGFGIFEDDYDTFLEQRASLLAKEIMKIITDFG